MPRTARQEDGRGERRSSSRPARAAADDRIDLEALAAALLHRAPLATRWVRCQFHEFSLSCAATGDQLACATRECLRPFADKPPSSDSLLRIFVCEVNGEEALTPGPLAGLQPSLACESRAGAEYRSYSRGPVSVTRLLPYAVRAVDTERGVALCCVNADSGAPTGAIAQSLVQGALVELLRAQHWYAVHAAAAGRGGRAVLITGGGGVGKTTLALALVRAGYKCLGDDQILVARRNGQPVLHCLSSRISFRADMCTLLPELRSAPPAHGQQSVGKRAAFVEDIFRKSVAATAEPALILAPRLSGAQESSVEELSRTEALRILVDSSPGRLEPAAGAVFFELVADVVDASRCYRLGFGRDLDRAVRLIDSLMG